MLFLTHYYLAIIFVDCVLYFKKCYLGKLTVWVKCKNQRFLKFFEQIKEKM